MKYFDTHAHYYDERFEREADKPKYLLLSELFSGNVSYIVNVGTSPETSREAISEAKLFPNMYTAIGIHPSDTRFIEDMNFAIEEIKGLILDKSSKCVALGEIGLDYHYPDTDKEKQAAFFRRQMQLAEELNIPVVIHDREAHEDIMKIIREYPSVVGIMHSFSGSAEMARELVALGYMISFSGTVTFTNAKRPKEAVLAVPKSHILIETDSPYLAPHPLRGTLNTSKNLEYINRTVAELLSISEEECAALTEENAKRIFRIDA